MTQSVHANFESHEGELDGTITHTLTRKSRQIILTNDSSSAELQYKFNASESYGTLKPTETVSMNVWVRNVILLSSNPVNYRLWVYG